MMFPARIRGNRRGLLLRQPVLNPLPEARHQHVRAGEGIRRMDENPRRRLGAGYWSNLGRKVGVLPASSMAMRCRMRVSEIKSSVNVRGSFSAVLHQRVQRRAESNCASQYEAGGEMRSDELSES